MGKSIKAEMLPLIKQPVDVILAEARAAGRAAFVTRAMIEDHCDAISDDWLKSVMPSSLGLMDDDAFTDLVRKAMAAFDEGVEQHLADCTTIAALQREVKDEQFDKAAAAEIIHWLAGMFSAIEKAARDLPYGSTRALILQLAGCGNYVASDRADTLGYTDTWEAEASHE